MDLVIIGMVYMVAPNTPGTRGTTAPDRIMEKKRFNLQAPPVYDRKVTNLFFP